MASIAVKEERQDGASAGWRAWLLVLLLTLAYTSSYADRQVFVLSLDPIRNALRISDTEVGLLSGLAFALTYAGAAVPLAYLSDRLSRKGVIICGILVWSAATAACGLARNYPEMFMARMALGLGEAALSPAAYAMIAGAFPARQLNIAFSIYVLGAVAGSGLGFAFGGAVMNALQSSALPSFGDLPAWRLVFIYVAASGPVVAAALLLLAPAGQAHRPQATAASAGFGSVLRARAKIYAPLFLGAALLESAVIALFSWTPTLFARTYGWSTADLGVELGLALLIAGPAGMIVGAGAAKWMGRRGHISANLKISALAALGTGVSGGAIALCSQSSEALNALRAAVFFASMPVALVPAALQRLTPDFARARVSSLYLLCVNAIGGVLGASSVAYVSDHILGEQRLDASLALALTVVSPLAAISLLVASRVHKTSSRS